jgi:hypothetical protein
MDELPGQKDSEQGIDTGVNKNLWTIVHGKKLSEKSKKKKSKIRSQEK